MEDGAPRDCLTARYRMSSGAALGTLIAAVASDLLLLLDGASQSPPPTLSGDLLPAWRPNVQGTPWRRLLVSSGWADLARRLSATGVLEPTWITSFFQELGLGQASEFGPLVLFGEVEEPGDVQVWADAATSLLRLLPAGVGIVLAGAPREFRLPIDPSIDTPDGGRYMDLDVPDVSPSTEDVLRYTEAALSGDQAAKRDRLNVGRYASALSRLVLLPETKPITLGIHGPWGSGKSSFMELIRQELIRQAAETEAPTLSKSLDATEHQLQATEHDMFKAEGDHQHAIATERAAQDEKREKLLLQLERAAQHRVISVFFNAWQYENATQV